MASHTYRLEKALDLGQERVKSVEQEVRFNGAGLKTGWGVFMVTGGIEPIPGTVLRSVWVERQKADDEASRLQDTEGERVLEVPQDPDSSDLRRTDFFVDRVKLTGFNVLPEVTVVSFYEREIPTEQQ